MCCEYLMFVRNCKAIVKIILELQWRNSQECSDFFVCSAFGLLETVPGSVVTQEFRERDNFGIYKLGQFVQHKSKIIFRIA